MSAQQQRRRLDSTPTPPSNTPLVTSHQTGAHFGTVCKGCDIQCRGCTVEGKEPMCLEKLDHSTSAGGNTTLETLLIEGGYWRATKKSMAIVACFNSEACLGGLTGDQEYCGKGYEGPCEYEISLFSLYCCAVICLDQSGITKSRAFST